MEMHLDREILEDPTQFALIVFHLSTALLHTQEVTGSSPVVSTKQFLISQEIRNCSFALREIVDHFFGPFSAGPSRDPCGKRNSQHRTGNSLPGTGCLWVLAAVFHVACVEFGGCCLSYLTLPD